MKAIKRLIKKILYLFFPIKNVIIFESKPDCSDNTKAVFDEMLARGLNKKYKMVWLVKNKSISSEIKENVCLIDTYSEGLKQRNYWHCAKVFICCNSYLIPVRKNQVSFYLSHGTPLKSVRAYYNIPNTIDYSFCAGEGIKDVYCHELNYSQERTVALGYPRNDDLTNYKLDVKKFFEGNFEKIIVWYPTFRQHGGSKTLAKGNALPIIHDAEMAKRLNEYAKERNVLLVLKPHFAQDLSYLDKTELSNIKFIDDEFFVKNKISSYQFVGNCDALITDYSSIYYDFTLCDKPIALVWEDIEEYKEKPGLIKDYEFYTKGAEKVYTIDDFEGFIDRLTKGIDLLQVERNEIKKLVNYSDDGQNAKRVVDFIMEKIKTKR